ncbi:MAG: alpha-amylase family glycosyl hydrolase [Verrucomicrobiota bacterium]
MVPIPPHPLLFQVNARQLTLAVKREIGRDDATLADVPEAWLERWRQQGFQVIWLCGVWQTGEAGKQVAASHPGVLTMFDELLPDWTGADVAGSPYAVSAYTVHRDFGGDGALAGLRARMAERGLALVLDFVPNHTARDHHWVGEHPEFYVRYSDEEARANPDRWMEIGDEVFAFGRDPYFPSWTDTLQLDYSLRAFRVAMIEQLVAVSRRCDGLRCDMAMLVLSDVFEGTWGRAVPPEEGEFWAHAIDAVRHVRPDFRFYAEAYWGTEGRLHWLGFDAIYHKTLYDNLREHHLDAVRAQLGDALQLKNSVVFLENHDEPRAARDFPEAAYRHAALTLTLGLPAVRLVHDGQREGRRVRHAIQLARRAPEAPDPPEEVFYDRLYAALVSTPVGTGSCRVLATESAGGEDGSFARIAALLWREGESPIGAALVVVNLALEESVARLPVCARGVAGRMWKLDDLLSDETYIRAGDELSAPGLFLKMAPGQAQVFRLSRA